MNNHIVWPLYYPGRSVIKIENHVFEQIQRGYANHHSTFRFRAHNSSHQYTTIHESGFYHTLCIYKILSVKLHHLYMFI